MLKKYGIIFMFLLCFLAIFSTGFASWYIDGRDISSSVDGPFSTYGVVNDGGNNEHITTLAEAFNYYNNSFLIIQRDQEGNIIEVEQTSLGYIIINVTIDDLSQYSNSTISLDFSQIGGTVNIITDKYLKNIYLNTFETPLTTIYSDFQTTASCQIDLDVDKEYTFIIEFDVDRNDDVFFNNLLYNNVSFSYFVTIEGDLNE